MRRYLILHSQQLLFVCINVDVIKNWFLANVCVFVWNLSFCLPCRRTNSLVLLLLLLLWPKSSLIPWDHKTDFKRTISYEMGFKRTLCKRIMYFVQKLTYANVCAMAFHIQMMVHHQRRLHQAATMIMQWHLVCQRATYVRHHYHIFVFLL